MVSTLFLGISIVQYLSMPRARIKYYLMSSIFFLLATTIAFYSILDSPELIVSIPLSAMTFFIGYSYQIRSSLSARRKNIVPEVTRSEDEGTGQTSIILIENGAPLHYRLSPWTNRLKTLQDEGVSTGSFWARPFLFRTIRNMTDGEEMRKAKEEKEAIISSLEKQIMVDGETIITTLSLEDHPSMLQRMIKDVNAGVDQIIVCPLFLGQPNRYMSLREVTHKLGLDELGVDVSFIEHHAPETISVSLREMGGQWERPEESS